MSTPFFRPIALSFNGARIGYDEGLLHPTQAIKFLNFMHKHIRPEFGYIYTSIPDINDILGSGISSADPHLGLLQVGLSNLRKWLHPPASLPTATLSRNAENGCPLCSFTTSLPEPTGHTQAARRACSSESIANVVAPILRFSKQVAFIDPYILRLPRKPKMQPQDASRPEKPSKSPEIIVENKIKTIVELIEASPKDTLFAILSTIHQPRQGEKPGSKENPDGFMTPPELRAELEKHIPKDAWVIVWNIEERKNGPRFHGRYIHTIDFTVGIEGGLDNENKGERTDVYFLNQAANISIYREYISHRRDHFETLGAWLKIKGSNKFLGIRKEQLLTESLPC